MKMNGSFVPNRFALLVSWILLVCLGLGCGPVIRRVSLPMPPDTLLDADCGTVPSAISADGHYVAYVSQAGNLTSGDGNGSSADVFRRNMENRDTVLVSRTSTGQSGNDVSGAINGPPGTPAVLAERARLISTSADGKRILFGSYATNLGAPPTSGSFALYVRDLLANQTWNVPPVGPVLDTVQWGAISGDGAFVAFVAFEPGTSRTEIYRWQVGSAGTPVLVSTNSAGESARAVDGTSDLVHAAINYDGDIVAFSADVDNLTPTSPGTSGLNQVYVKNIATGDVALCSHQAGDPDHGGSAGSLRPSLSADGLFVAFESGASDLVAGFRSGGHTNVFVCDPWHMLPGPGVVAVSRAALDVDVNGDSETPMLCGNGTSIVFDSSATNLVSPDDNGATRDVYRVSLGESAGSGLTAGAAERVSVKRGGMFGMSTVSTTEPSLLAACSETASKVVFETREEMITSGEDVDSDAHVDIYMRDFDAEKIVLTGIGSSRSDPVLPCDCERRREWCQTTTVGDHHMFTAKQCQMAYLRCLDFCG